MSVTAAAGFRAAGVTAGLKPSGARDLAVVINDGPSRAAAADKDGPSLMTTATSRAPDGLSPAATPAARNPSGAVTLTSWPPSRCVAPRARQPTPHPGTPGRRAGPAPPGATVSQGATPCVVRPAVSGRPSMRLAACTAWPAAPLPRLSSAATTTARPA